MKQSKDKYDELVERGIVSESGGTSLSPTTVVKPVQTINTNNNTSLNNQPVAPVTPVVEPVYEQTNLAPNVEFSQPSTQNAAYWQAVIDRVSQPRNTTPYNSQYQSTLNELAKSYLNREKFSYDPYNDPDYQSYLNAYQREGNKAMQDTLAQVAARTGGIASTYAVQAANGAYNDYLERASDMIPQLRLAAYEKYMNEGNNMLNAISLYQNLDNVDYSRYQDDISNQYAREQMDYKMLQDALSNQFAREQWDYQKQQDEIANKLNQDKFNYSKYQDALARKDKLDAQNQDYQLALAKLSASGEGQSTYDSKMVDRFREIYSNLDTEKPQYNIFGNLKSGSEDYLMPLISEIKMYVENTYAGYSESDRNQIARQYAQLAGLSQEDLSYWF